MAETCGKCHQKMRSFDDHPTCSHCKLAAGYCQLNISHPARSARAGQKSLRGNLEDLSSGPRLRIKGETLVSSLLLY